MSGQIPVISEMSNEALAVALGIFTQEPETAIEAIKSDPDFPSFIEEAVRRLTHTKISEPYRVFCDKHDPYRARYTNGRPLIDDRCPHCVIDSLESAK